MKAASGLSRQQWLHFFRLMGVSCLIFFGSFLLVASALVFFNKDLIKNLVVSSVNKNLTTRVEVEKVDVSFFRSFPNASVYFKNVKAYGVEEVQKNYELLSASSIYLQFSVWDIIRGKYKIKEVEVNNLKLFPLLDAFGRPNYLIWNQSSEETNEDFSFNLQRVRLNKTTLIYKDLKNQRTVSAFVPKATLKGDFTKASYQLTIQADIDLKEIEWEQQFTLHDKYIVADLNLWVENNQVFYFKKALVDFQSHMFDISGQLDLKEENPHFDLKVEGRKILLQKLIHDLPESISKHLAGFRARGELNFNAVVKGFYTPVSMPYLEADFGIANGELSKRGVDFAMRNISFNGSYANGQKRNLRSSELKIRNFSALFKNGFVKADFSAKDLVEPLVSLQIKAEAELSELIGFYKPDTLLAAKGGLNIDFSFQSKLSGWSNFTRFDFLNSKSAGEAKLINASFVLKDSPLTYSDFNGRFSFSNNDIDIHAFSGKAASSDFFLKGSLVNVLPYLFVKDQHVLIDADFTSENLNLDELLNKSSSPSDTAFRLSLNEKLQFNLKAKVGNLNFRKFNASKIEGQLRLRDKKLLANNVLMATMDGTLRASGLLDGSRAERIVISLDGVANKIDITKLFYQLGNFGQESLKSEHIKGRLSADIQMTSLWSPALEIDWGSLKTTANLVVENGELVNYEPMNVLSRFIRVDELQHIRFSTLENQIRIQDRMIIIPSMDIKSSALDIKLSGTHSFENVIDYRFQILLSDLLWSKARRAKKENEDFGQVIDDGLGRTTLFLSLTGTVDNPVVKYDRAGAREKFRDDMRKERQTLKEAFRQEFNLNTTPENQLDSNSFKARKREESKRIKKQEKGEFIIEWD